MPESPWALVTAKAYWLISKVPVKSTGDETSTVTVGEFASPTIEAISPSQPPK